MPWGQACLSHGTTEQLFLPCCLCTHSEEASQGHSEAGSSLIKSRAAICPLQEMTLELPILSFKNVLKTSSIHQHQAVCCPSWTRGCSRRRAVCRPPWTRTCSRRQPVCAHDGHGTAPSTKQYAPTMDIGLLHEKQAIKGDRHIRTRNDLHFWQESQCPRSPRIDFLLRDKAQSVGLKLPGNRSKRPQ